MMQIDFNKWSDPADVGIAKKRLEVIEVMESDLADRWAELSREVGLSIEQKKERRTLDLQLAKVRVYKRRIKNAIKLWER